MKIFLTLSFFLASVVLGTATYYVESGATQNLLAEAAGSFFSIFLAILVVDRMQDYFRASKWKKVRILTYRTLNSHICDALSNTYIFMPLSSHAHMGKIINGRIEPNKSVIEGINELARDLEQNKKYSTTEKSFSDFCVEFYESNAKWDIDQITNSILPRVMQESSDQELINALVSFDSKYREFINAIIAHREVVTHSIAEPFISFVKEFGVLYQCLERAWNKTV